MYGVGRERLGAALRLPGAESLTSERAAVLVSMGYMAWKQGALAEARACHEESLTLSRNSGDAHSIIVALEGLGWVSFDENDPGAARACFEEALALARDTREGHLIGLCLNALAFLAWERGDLSPGARALGRCACSGARFGESMEYSRGPQQPNGCRIEKRSVGGGPRQFERGAGDRARVGITVVGEPDSQTVIVTGCGGGRYDTGGAMVWCGRGARARRRYKTALP